MSAQLATADELRACLAQVTTAIDSLLVANNPPEIDADACPAEVEPVIAATNRLIAFVREIEEFIEPLASGDLSAPLPSRANYLASPFKQLHSRLNELTRQTTQIAKGDYSQRVDFMGEFSVAFNSMVELLAAREDELRTASIVDALTGLANRRGFFALGEQALRDAERNGTALTVVYGDLDGMKTINDHLGHEQGDNALKDIAGLLRATVRDSDIVARLGGDEFVILGRSTPAEAVELCRRLRSAIEVFNAGEDRLYKLKLSLGTAAFEARRFRTLEELLGEADQQMYEDKRSDPIRWTEAD
jgi:two-component system cell cycle response regulator